MRWLLLGDAGVAAGFQLAGLETRVVDAPAAVVRTLAELEAGEPVHGVVLMTPAAAALAPHAVERLVQRTEPPLLVVLPEPVKPAPAGART